MSKKKSGFSLVELILVVAVIGIIAAMVLPRYQNLDTTARNNADQANIAMFNSASELYRATTGNGAYAVNMATLCNDATIFPEGCPSEDAQGVPSCPNGNNYVLGDGNNGSVLGRVTAHTAGN